MRLTRVLAGLLVVTACTSATPASSPSPEGPIRGGRLVVAMPGRLERIQPAIDGPSPPTSYIYETLIQFDVTTGAVVNGLGTLRQSRDGRVYTVEIDEHAVWSDGTPLTAQDWLTAVSAIARTKTTGDWLREFSVITEVVGFAEYASRRASDIAGVTANGRTLTVSMKRALCRAESLFGVTPPLPTHVFGRYVAEGGPDISTAVENAAPPVSSGPFVVKEWRKGDLLTFARNERYWRGPPALDEFVWRFVSPETQVEQLERGAVMGMIPSAADVPILEQLPGVTLYRYTPLGYTFIAWDNQSDFAPGLRDKRVRQALAHAFDMDLAMRLVPYGTRVHSTFPAGSWAYTAVTPRAYDPSRAEELLRSAGYARGAAGDLEKEGRPLLIRVSANRSRVGMAQLLVDQYARLGIRATTTVEDVLEGVERLRRGERDAIIMSVSFRTPDPDQSTFWHSASIEPRGGEAGAGINVARFAHAEVDRALNDAASPSSGDCSRARRSAQYARVAQILAEEQPIHFGFVADRFVAMSSRLRGFSTGPFSSFRDVDPHRWWLAPEKK